MIGEGVSCMCKAVFGKRSTTVRWRLMAADVESGKAFIVIKRQLISKDYK